MNIFSVFSTLLILANAHAQFPGTPEQSLSPGVFDNFCGDPKLAVCADFNAAPIGRVLRKSKLRERIQSQSLAYTIQAHRLPLAFTLADLRFYQPLERTSILSTYRSNLNNLLKIEVALVEFNALTRQIENVRTYLIKAVHAQVSSLDPATAPYNRALLAEINRTTIIESVKLENMIAQKNPDAESLLSGFNKYCGEDGLSDNAYASNVNGNKYLVVCPGLLIAGVGAGYDDQGNFRNAIQTLAHEWGHHIDARYFADLYSKYMDCLVVNGADKLKDPGQLGSDPHASINQANMADVRRVVSHAAEITADYWGNQAITQYFFFNMQNKSLREKLGFLRESHGALCWSQDDLVHPDGGYRIGVLLRTDPAISYYMGCSTRNYVNIPKGCNLSGQFR